MKKVIDDTTAERAIEILNAGKEDSTKSNSGYILVIPDIHGRSFWRDSMEYVEDFDQIVFLGDYLDPYPQEGITIDDAFWELTDIMKFKRQYPDKVTLLLGNHDLHYYWTEMDCSRRAEDYLTLLHDIFTSFRKLFSLAYELKTDNKAYLFTHAGVLQGWLEENEVQFSVEWYNSLLDDEANWQLLNQSGFIRCGLYECGSPIWADAYEHAISPPLPDVYQIFGHTQQNKEPIIKDHYACLDCRRMFILNIKTGEIVS